MRIVRCMAGGTILRRGFEVCQGMRVGMTLLAGNANVFSG